MEGGARTGCTDVETLPRKERGPDKPLAEDPICRGSFSTQMKQRRGGECGPSYTMVFIPLDKLY